MVFYAGESIGRQRKIGLFGAVCAQYPAPSDLSHILTPGRVGVESAGPGRYAVVTFRMTVPAISERSTAETVFAMHAGVGRVLDSLIWGECTEIREISGKNLDLDLGLDLDADLDSRQPAAGSQTGQLKLLAAKRMVYVQVEVQV